jgi:hypothetical protein
VNRLLATGSLVEVETRRRLRGWVLVLIGGAVGYLLAVLASL